MPPAAIKTDYKTLWIALAICPVVMIILVVSGGLGSSGLTPSLMSASVMRGAHLAVTYAFQNHSDITVSEAIEFAVKEQAMVQPLRWYTGEAFLINPSVEAWKANDSDQILIWVEPRPGEVWPVRGDGTTDYYFDSQAQRPLWLPNAINGADFDYLYDGQRDD